MSSDKDLIQELRTESIRHLTTAFAQVRCEALGALNTLPYEQLLGPGLERLCFELLLTNGFEPRFFGRSGQAQFEVDLIASKDGRTELYQCKNTQLHQKDISRILEAFETQWLGQQGLPQPARYVICSPSLLRDVMQDRHWLQAKQAIETRHPGLSVELWHRDMLDGWLKRLPDVVADLFSDRHAELFCGLDDWHPGLFTAVREDAPGDPRLDRFLEQHGKAGVYLHPPYQSALDEALAASPVVLVHGRQACGKTFAALTHASGGNARGWRSYFIDVGGDDFDRGALYDGVRRRSTRPSLFVLENAHAKPEEVALGLRKLRQHLSGGRVRVICLSRIDLSDDDLPTDAHAVFAELKETGATVAFANDEKVLLGLLRHLRPDLDGLSPARRQRLFALSGRDLLALSELLRGIADPAQIDTLSVTDLYDTLRRQYFNGRLADEFPAVRELAALAQFDLKPLTALLPIPEREQQNLNQLCRKAGRPPRWQFVHSSAAELVLHALCAGHGLDTPDAVAEWAGQRIVEYLGRVVESSASLASDTITIEPRALLRNRLTLLNREQESRLKLALLDDPAHAFLRLFAANGSVFELFKIVESASAALAEAMLTALEHNPDQVTHLIERTIQSQRSIGTLSLALRELRMDSERRALGERLERAIGGPAFLRLIAANGSVFELFSILKQTSAALAEAMLTALEHNPDQVTDLIERTIQRQRSIGTLDLTLRELRMDSERRALGERLER
ncbi:MAG: hypothetical protein NW204_10155, partial [Xanthomonadaceae bacterium]|nr:hypothetical protein [Xanthomonadaceae bacterium]